MSDKPKVIIVEDSPTQAKQIAAKLAAQGIEVIIAEDGVAGLRAVDENRPDLVVLDVHLPKMDGYQVCRRLKRDINTAHIPIIMLTQFDGSGAALRGLESGADDYIPKDRFATENLLDTLQAFGLIEREE